MNLARLYLRLSEDEGKRSKPYRCTAGKLTIGVGRNLDDRGVREDEIALMFNNDVLEAIGDCRRLFRSFDALNDVRKEVVVNMMFNLGYTRLAGFKKFLAAVQAGKWSDASREMLDSKWADQVGRRADRLANAMRKGVWE